MQSVEILLGMRAGDLPTVLKEKNMFGFFKKLRAKRGQRGVDAPREEGTSDEGDFNDFLLTVASDGGETSKRIADPTETDLARAVEQLLCAERNFVVLESKEPFDGYTYMQATGYDGNVYVEIQRKQEVDGRKLLRNFGKEWAYDALCGMFVRFLSHDAPDITGWDQTFENTID